MISAAAGKFFLRYIMSKSRACGAELCGGGLRKIEALQAKARAGDSLRP